MVPPAAFAAAEGRSTDVVEYGPGVDDESELRLLGPLASRRILDVGCGTGSGSVALALAGARVIAVESAPITCTRARERATEHSVTVDVHQAGPAELAFLRGDLIDAALSVYSLASVDDIDRVFRQVHRVLRPDAPFVVSVPHPALALARERDRAAYGGTTERWTLDGATGTQHPHTVASLFGSFVRAGFEVDTLRELFATRERAGRWWDPAMDRAPASLILRGRKLGV